MRFPTVAIHRAWFPHPTTAPWHADTIGAELAKPDQGGKQEANGGKLALIRAVQAFTCHGASSSGAAFQFYSSSFSIHNTGSLLLSSLKKVTFPSFSPSSPSSSPPHEKTPSPCSMGAALCLSKKPIIQPRRRCPGSPGARRSADQQRPRRSTARCSSHRSGADKHS